jgi:hypothetical protein
MGIACKINRDSKGTPISVTTEKGADSILFKEALKLVKDPFKALNLYTVSHLPVFKEKVSNPLVQKHKRETLDALNRLTSNKEITIVSEGNEYTINTANIKTAPARIEGSETETIMNYSHDLPNGESVDMGFIQLKESPEGYQVIFSNLNESLSAYNNGQLETLQGKGIGTEMYKQLGIELIGAGETLYSDFSYTPQAEGVWKKMEKAGLASQTTIVDNNGKAKTVYQITPNPSQFDKNGEPKLSEITKYIGEQSRADKKLTFKQTQDIKNALRDNPNLKQDIVNAYITDGLFYINRQKLLESGLYSLPEVNEIISNAELQNEIKASVKAFLNHSTDIAAQVDNSPSLPVVSKSLITPIINRLKKTGLALNTFVLSNEGIKNKLKSIGVNENVLNQIIGKKGAQNLDNVEEVTFRLDNLSIAREMEFENKTPKEIKLLTNWERGADKLWKYEIDDSKFSTKDITVNLSTSNKEFEGKSQELKLSDILDAKELYKAYPQMKDTRVVLYSTKGIFNQNSQFHSNKNFYINIDQYGGETNFRKHYISEGGQSGLLHEIQHYIQQTEGFARGGSPEGLKRRISKLFTSIRVPNKEGVSIEDNYIRRAVRTVADINEETLEDFAKKEKRELVAAALGRLIYSKLAGEVEAINVQKRANLTQEERKQLLEDTEEVSREDQIFLTNPDIEAQIVGEKGAQNLDNSEEVTFRLESLSIAREMEDTKTPKEIRIATNWERGADNKWRYEVQDIELSVDEVEVGKEYKYTDLVKNNELTKAYPELKNIKVIFKEDGKNSFRPDTGYIEFDTKNAPEYVDKSATGGLQATNSGRQGEVEKYMYRLRPVDRKNLLHESAHFVQWQENFYRGGSPYLIREEAERISGITGEDQLGVQVSKTLKALGKENLTPSEDKMLRAYLKAIDGEADAVSVAYKNISGEVEARNIEMRANTPFEERRDSLLQETEDVRREDQIFLRQDNVQFQVVGEKGAQTLDKAEEVNFRINSLNIAKKIETSGKNPKEIKIITNWERGSDNKWRYEVPDVEFSIDEVELGKEYKYTDIVKANKFTKAYPELNNIKVIFNDRGRNQFRVHRNSIELSTRIFSFSAYLWEQGTAPVGGREGYMHRLSADSLRNLIHESAHFVQGREGFSGGGSTVAIEEEARRLSETEGESSKEVQLEKVNKSLLRTDITQSDRNVLEAYKLSLQRDYVGFSNRGYRSIAGEVEARNMEKRSSMSMEDRRSSLLEDTADVSPQDQIFLKQNGTQLKQELGGIGLLTIPNGFVFQNEVYLNKDKMSLSTPIHEFSHIFLNNLKETNPEIYQKGLALIEKDGQQYIDFVKKNQPNLKGAALYDEALAQAIGDRGARIINKSKKNSFTKWLADLWEVIKNSLGLSEYTADQVQNMNLGEFADAVAIDLLKGKNIGKFIQPEKDTSKVNSLGLYESTNPFLQEKEVVQLLGGIKDRSLFEEKLEDSELENLKSNYFEDPTFANEFFEEMSVLNRIREFKITDGKLSRKNNSETKALLEETLIVGVENGLNESITYLETLPEDIWQNNSEDIVTLLEDIREKAVGIGLNLNGLEDSYINKTKNEVISLLNSVKNVNLQPNNLRLEELTSLYDEFFQSDKSGANQIELLPKEHREKSLIYLKSDLSEYELFNSHSLLRVRDNVYQKVDKDGTSLEVLTQALPNIDNAAKFIENGVTNLETPNFSVDNEVLQKMFAFKIYFNLEINNQQSISEDIQLKEYSNFTGNLGYLQKDFVADFNKNSVKELQKESEAYTNFYTHFKITNKGIELNNTDPISMEQIKDYLNSNEINEKTKENLLQYSIVSKSLDLSSLLETNSIVKTEEFYRDFYTNNPIQAPKAVGQYSVINESTIAAKGNPKFIRTPKGVFEAVTEVGGQSIYKKLPETNTDFNQLDVEQPELNLDLSKFNHLQTAPSKVVKAKNYYSNKELAEIDNQFFNCG